MRLSEQKVLVIGGSSGMGLAIATASALAGAEVLIASRSDSRLKEAAEKIGSGVKWHTVDFTDEISVKRFFDFVCIRIFLQSNLPGSSVGVIHSENVIECAFICDNMNNSCIDVPSILADVAGFVGTSKSDCERRRD